MTDTNPELIEQIKKLRSLVEPYMKKGVEGDWQEYIAETDNLYILFSQHEQEALKSMSMIGLPDMKYLQLVLIEDDKEWKSPLIDWRETAPIAISVSPTQEKRQG